MRFSKMLALCCASLAGAVSAATSDRMLFAFELTRHGARAPTSDSDGYTIGPGILTPEGMRQRYLLGAQNRKRYVDEFKLLSGDDKILDEIYMQSTNVNRTMQSGYSELMGLLPAGALGDTTLTQKQMDALDRNNAGLPFKVRNSYVLNTMHGTDALPRGFEAFQIYEFIDDNLRDDLGLGGCTYVDAGDGANFSDNETYKAYYPLIDVLREPFEKCFGVEIKPNDFLTLYDYCDVVQSDEFEGLWNDRDCPALTRDQLAAVNQTVLATLELPMADPVLIRNMYVSKQLRVPLHMMTWISECETNGDLDSCKDLPSQRLFMYSTHDWTVTQMLLFLAADNNAHFMNVPFASQVFIELYSRAAEGQSSTSDDLYVEAYFNGKRLEFADCKTNGQCTFGEFTHMLATVKGFVSTTTNYVAECATPYQSFTNFGGFLQNEAVRSNRVRD